MDDALLKMIAQQQEEFLKLQVIVYSLVDTMIENNIISQEEIDTKIQEKVNLVKKIVDTQVKKFEVDNLTINNIFNGPIGEA